MRVDGHRLGTPSVEYVTKPNKVSRGFESVTHANDYLASDLFTGDVVRELGPLLQADPEIRVFDVA